MSAALLAAVALVATSPAVSAREQTHGVSKSDVKWSVKHNAVVFAASYAQARRDGSSHEKAVKKAQQAFLAGSLVPVYVVSGATRGYQSSVSDISGDRSMVYISLTPGFSKGVQDAGYSYCLSVNLTALNDGYTPSAMSKPKLGYTTTVNSGCQPVSASR